VKLLVTHCALEFRRRHANLFLEGSYEPLAVEGPRAANICAFARAFESERLVVVAPRLLTRLMSGLDLPLGVDTWGDSWLDLGDDQPGRSYRDVFTGRVLRARSQGSGAGLTLAEVFRHFSLAMLQRVDE